MSIRPRHSACMQQDMTADNQQPQLVRPRKSLAVGPGGPSAPPPALATNTKNTYPWSHLIVFRSGPYLVYRITGPMGNLSWPAALNTNAASKTPETGTRP